MANNKIKIRWSVPFKEGYNSFDAKIDGFFVNFSTKGTILAPISHAEVVTHFKYNTKSGEKIAVRIVEGLSAEVYHYYLFQYEGTLKERFLKEWTHANDKFHKDNVIKSQLYKTPKHKKSFSLFPTANTNEKLIEKVTSHGMQPRKFAEKIDKDYSVLFRELKGQRQLTLKQAVEYAKELDCDPVDLLFEDLHCGLWGNVDLYNISDVGNEKYYPCQIFPQVEKKIVVPRNIYRPNITAIQIFSPGSWLDRQYAYYYKTEVDSSAHNGKMVIARTTDDSLADIGFETQRYWFGIYEIQKGGKQIINNPDPSAEKQFITSGPFDFVAPVISLCKPTALKRDYNYYQLNQAAGTIFRYQQAIEKINAEMIKIQEQQKELEVKLYEQKMKDLYLEKEKTMQIVPEWLRKNVG